MAIDPNGLEAGIQRTLNIVFGMVPNVQGLVGRSSAGADGRSKDLPCRLRSTRVSRRNNIIEQFADSDDIQIRVAVRHR